MFLKYKNFTRNEDGIIFQHYLGNSYPLLQYGIQSHAVLLLETGASIKYVSQKLEHKSIKTTTDTYLDKIEEDELKKFASYTQRKI